MSVLSADRRRVRQRRVHLVRPNEHREVPREGLLPCDRHQQFEVESWLDATQSARVDLYRFTLATESLSGWSIRHTHFPDECSGSCHPDDRDSKARQFDGAWAKRAIRPRPAPLVRSKTRGESDAQRRQEELLDIHVDRPEDSVEFPIVNRVNWKRAGKKDGVFLTDTK